MVACDGYGKNEARSQFVAADVVPELVRSNADVVVLRSLRHSVGDLLRDGIPPALVDGQLSYLPGGVLLERHFRLHCLKEKRSRRLRKQRELGLPGQLCLQLIAVDRNIDIHFGSKRIT